MTKERQEILDLLFQTYPDTKCFYLTSDNQAFPLVSDANNHAASLVEQSVDKCERTPSAKSEKYVKKSGKPKKEVAPSETAPLETASSETGDSISSSAEDTSEEDDDEEEEEDEEQG